MTDYMNTKEVCEMLRCSRQTVYKKMEKGMPHIKDGRSLLFDKRDIDRYHNKLKIGVQ